MTIHLYAEHLLHIRAISIQAALPTDSDKDTRATLSADGRFLTLSHAGETASIQLPVNIPGGQNAAPLTLPAAPTKHLSFRVQLQEKSDSNCLSDLQADENIVPWSAQSLTPDTQFNCIHCQQTLLERGKIRVWKDLPSENWAEMMDFWHCHRPHVLPDQDHHTPAKGYSADSTLALASGIGMVDPVDFVLASEDCPNLQISSKPDNKSAEATQLACNSCHTVLGHVHTSGGYKLRKLHLLLSPAPNQDPVSFSAEKWWSCLLLSSIECQGVRKFAATSTTASSSQALKLWIFSPDMTVSTSTTAASGNDEPFRATKVFWQDCNVATQDTGALNRAMLAEGELELPPDEMRELRDKLASSVAFLPEKARTFQEWNVAILQRFTRADVVVK